MMIVGQKQTSAQRADTSGFDPTEPLAHSPAYSIAFYAASSGSRWCDSFVSSTKSSAPSFSTAYVSSPSLVVKIARTTPSPPQFFLTTSPSANRAMFQARSLIEERDSSLREAWEENMNKLLTRATDTRQTTLLD